MLSSGWRNYYWSLMIARALLTYLIFIDVAYNAKLLNLSDAFKQHHQVNSSSSTSGSEQQQTSSSRRSTRSAAAVYLAPGSDSPDTTSGSSGGNGGSSSSSSSSDGIANEYVNDQPLANGGPYATVDTIQCCACDEAKYELVFEGLWSRYTHPDDFPENYWLAHFSDIIGASHSNQFRMWDQDTLATEGVRELAETGSTKKLEAELKQVSSKTRTIIKARELRYPLLNGKTSAVFRTDRQHHLVSILSKLNPSPDWILGVSGLELCQSDCSWATQRVVNLYLWDAGTDSGITFTAPDLPTRPQERIHPYRKERKASNTTPSSSNSQQQQQQQQDDQTTDQSGYPQRRSPDFLSSPQDQPYTSADSSVVNPVMNGGADSTTFTPSSSSPSRPFARLTITRQRIYEKSCNSSGGSGGGELAAPMRKNGGYSSSMQSSLSSINPLEWAETTTTSQVDCRYTDWSDWSSCSSNCGKGIRTRTRSFVDEQAHQSSNGGCSQMNLIEKEICLSECIGNVTCVTRDWSEWSRCSVTCGQGIRKRTRSPIGQMKKACGRIELSQSEVCIASHNVDCSPPADSNGCEVTDWSQWSKCSVACGKGTRIRTRQYLRKDGSEMFCNNTLIQKTSCTGRLESCSPDTNSSNQQSNSNSNNNNNNKTNANSSNKLPAKSLVNQYTCLKPADSGPCKASIQRWHYQASLNACSRFSYGGCLGNSNNYETYQDCERSCLMRLRLLPTAAAAAAVRRKQLAN